MIEGEGAILRGGGAHIRHERVQFSGRGLSPIELPHFKPCIWSTNAIALQSASKQKPTSDEIRNSALGYSIAQIGL
jgi:hypothetical protein